MHIVIFGEIVLKTSKIKDHLLCILLQSAAVLGEEAERVKCI